MVSQPQFQSFDLVVKGKKERERAELNFVELWYHASYMETVGMGKIFLITFVQSNHSEHESV